MCVCACVYMYEIMSVYMCVRVCACVKVHMCVCPCVLYYSSGRTYCCGALPDVFCAALSLATQRQD